MKLSPVLSQRAVIADEGEGILGLTQYEIYTSSDCSGQCEMGLRKVHDYDIRGSQLSKMLQKCMKSKRIYTL